LSGVGVVDAEDVRRLERNEVADLQRREPDRAERLNATRRNRPSADR